MLNQFSLAWHFLTAIPIRRDQHLPEPDQLAQAMSWFPAVGLILGALLAGASFLCDLVMPRSLSDGLAILFLILLTRCLHLDGLADTVDGWAGGRTAEQRLAIMRDPRIGAMGAVALIAAIGFRYLALSAVPDSGRWITLTSMPVVGRWAMVVGGHGMPYARSGGGLARHFLDHLRPRQVLLATLIAGGWLTWCFGFAATLGTLALAGCVARALGLLSMRLCHGLTGDVFGLINEIAEVAFLASAPTLMSRP